MNAGAAGLLFGIGALTASSIGQVSRYRRPPVEVDPDLVRAQALADAWYVVHTARWGPLHGGPDSFYAGCKTAEGRIEELPGFDKDVEPEAVLAYQERRKSTRTGPRSGRIEGVGPGGVGSTNRGLTPTTDVTGSEG